MKILYITHYGLLESLGQSQILPYLAGLARRRVSIHVISFEKAPLAGDAPRAAALRDFMGSLGMEWHPRPYHRGDSLASLLRDSCTTALEIFRSVRRTGFDLLHCRLHVPALMAWPTSAVLRKPMLFDFRGFMAEEYADAGMWRPQSLRYRITKTIERRLMRRSAATVVLTAEAGAYLQRAYGLNARRISVIPCCVDLDKFRPLEDRPSVGPGQPIRVVYSGSTMGRYNMRAMLRFFALLEKRRPGSRFTILSSSGTSHLRPLLEEMDVPADSVRLLALPQADVPRHLADQDLGLIFMRHSLALLATSPTKLGEYLASGIPVLAEEGLGDLAGLLPDLGIGSIIDSERPDQWAAELETATRLCEDPHIRKRCIQAARARFALPQGVDAYYRTYESTLNRRPQEACEAAADVR